MSGSTEPLGMRRQCPFGSGHLRDCRQPKRRGGRRRPTKVLQFPPRSREEERWSPADQPPAKPTRGAHPPTCQCSPSPGGRCSAPKNTLEGEGSMVLRKTVRRRRRWSEALAGGGPSIPLPFHAASREPQDPLDASPVALLILLPRPTRTGLVPPRLLSSGHRRPHPFLSVGHQFPRILG